MTAGFLSAVVGGALVVSLVTPLFAAEITVGGYTRIRYRLEENRQMDQTLESSSNKRNYFDQRVRIAVDAKLDEGLSGRIETDYLQDYGTNSPFDNAPTGASITTTCTVPAGGGTCSFTDTSPGAVGIRQAWVQAKVPGTPVTVRLGRDTSLLVAHGFTVGEGIYGTDQVRLGFPIGPAEPWLFYAVASDRSSTSTVSSRITYDEANVYGLTVPITAAPGIVVNPYAMMHHVGAGATTGEKNQYILGGSLDLKQGPMSAFIEAAFNGGRAREGGFVGGTFNNKAIRRAYFIAGGADVTEGIFKVGLEAGLSSGDKDGTSTSDGTAKNFDAPLHNHPLTFIHDVIAAPGPGTIGNNTTRRALGINGLATTDNSSAVAGQTCPGTSTSNPTNTGCFSPGQTFVKGSLQIKPSPEWTYDLAVTYYRATIVPGEAKRGIGTELYANVAWQMYKNFRVTARAGYIFAGPFFTRYDRTDGDPDNPFLSRIYGELTF